MSRDICFVDHTATGREGHEISISGGARSCGGHRRGFAQFWAWKSRRRGRPPTPTEIVALIVRMANDNPRSSRRRIATELAMPGYRVFVVLSLSDACILHVNATAHPNAEWTGQ